MLKTIRIIIAVTVLLSFSTAGIAQNLSGNLSGTLGSGSYNVVGNCTVQSGVTLIIQPGTTFQFNGNYSWSIYGQIDAVGTEAQPIAFTRQSGNWGGLKFNYGASTNTVLEYCTISNCYASSGGGVYIANGGITLRNSEITNCQATSGGGIFAQNATAALVIDGCYIANNTAGNGGGLYFSGCNGCVVKNSEIAYNSSTNT